MKPLNYSNVRQGYDAQNFLLYDDSSLAVLYSQAAAVLGLLAPLYLMLLQEALGGLEQTLVYGLRATALASSFLLLVHFISANAPLHATIAAGGMPKAPMHAQHALSLFFTTYQMHFVQAVALGYLFPTRLLAQPLPLTALMVASYVAAAILARSWGAVRCTFTAKGAAAALAVRPGAAHGAAAVCSRYLLALTFWATYAWRAYCYAQGGHLFSHATLGVLAFTGGWVHALHSWAVTRRSVQELARERAAAVAAAQRRDE